MSLFKFNLFEEEDDNLDNYILPIFTEEKRYDDTSFNLNNIVAENNISKLHSNYNVYTTIDNNKNNTSYNAYDNIQNFKTIDYGKIYENNNLIAFDVKTNIDNIFINNLPFEIIKKYSILHTLPLLDNKIIGLNEYQIFLFNKSSSENNYDLIYIYYSNIFSNINYNRFLNLIINYFSNPNEIFKYVNILVDKQNYYYSSIDIVNNQIILNNLIENNIISQDKNNISIIKKNNDNKLFRENKFLLNKLLNPILGYYDNDIFMVLGDYNNEKSILFTNNVKSSINNEEKTNYSIINLPYQPLLFIPINNDNILKIIYKYYDNEYKYNYYIIDNKFELLINNTTFNIVNGYIEFINDGNKYLIFIDNNNIQIRKDNIIVLNINYNNYEEYKKEIYYSIYGTVELIIKDIATLKFQNKIIIGNYTYDVVNQTYHIIGDENYIIKIKEKEIIINNNSYIYYSKNIINYKIYSNNNYIITYDTDLYNNINLSCNQIIKNENSNQPFKQNTQSNILITTKDYVRYKVYNDINNNKKYVFKCKKE